MFPFRISYQLTAKEFLKVSFATRYKRWQTRLITVLASVYIIAGIRSDLTIYVVAGLAALFVIPLLIVLRTLFLFSRSSSLTMPGTYDFSGEALLLNRGGLEIRIPWTQFTCIKHAAGFMTMQLNSNEGVILPMRLFEAEQLQAVQSKIRLIK